MVRRSGPCFDRDWLCGHAAWNGAKALLPSHPYHLLSDRVILTQYLGHWGIKYRSGLTAARMAEVQAVSDWALIERR